MSSTSLTVSDQLLTSTMFSYMKELTSGIDRPRFFLNDLEKLGKVEESGGERMIIPLNFNRHSVGTQLTSGYEPINLTTQPLGTPGHDGWMDTIRPVVFSGHEGRINRGKAKVLDLLQERVKDTYEGEREEIQTQILKGTIASKSDLNTLNGIDDSTGFLEATAYGSQSHVVHNISKATYASAVHWNNQWVDGGGSFSSNGLDGLYDILTRVLVLGGNTAKLRWYLSIACANLLKRGLNSHEQYLSESELDGGRRVMAFGGVPVQPLSDSDLPIAGATSTATPVSAMLIDFEHINIVVQQGAWFASGPFEKQSGFEVKASFMNTMAQLRAKRLSTSALLTNANVW